MVEPVHGVHLEHCGDEQQHHPLIVDVSEVVEIIAKQGLEESPRRIDHEYARHHKEDVGQALYVFEASDGEFLALVSLHHLHEGEHEGSQEKHPADYLLLPHKHEASCANDHERTAYKKNK